MKTTQEKFTTVIQKNTFYYFNSEFEENYEGYLNLLKETLLIVKNKIETEGLRKEIFEWLLREKENGLRALLALTGFSNEYLKRLLTIIRIVDNTELNALVYKDKWHSEQNHDYIKEWSDSTISKYISGNEYFRKGIYQNK
jgi:hypothetical protein